MARIFAHKRTKRNSLLFHRARAKHLRHGRLSSTTHAFRPNPWQLASLVAAGVRHGPAHVLDSSKNKTLSRCCWGFCSCGAASAAADRAPKAFLLVAAVLESLLPSLRAVRSPSGSPVACGRGRGKGGSHGVDAPSVWKEDTVVWCAWLPGNKLGNFLQYQGAVVGQGLGQRPQGRTRLQAIRTHDGSHTPRTNPVPHTTGQESRPCRTDLQDGQ